MRFCFGLAKKTLLAAPMGALADAAFVAGPGNLATLSAWIGVIAFAFQIYFFFSGYADMAAGVMQMAGWPADEAFSSPYQCDGITDFWRRWRLPLGDFGSERLGADFAILLTTLIGALWLGASWGLLIWAAIHAVLLRLERLTSGRAIYAAMPKPLRVAGSFFILVIAWVFFRASHARDAVNYLAVMFGAGPPLVTTSVFLDADMLRNFNTVHFIICALIVWAVPNTQTILRKPAAWKAFAGLAFLACSVLMSTKESGSPEFVRQLRQQWLVRFAGEGNQAVHIGTGGWLFPRTEIAALCGRGPLADSTAKTRGEADAMIELAGQFKKRGLPLVIVPVPAKAMIYPEHLTPKKLNDPVYHRDQLALYEKLRAAGADVIDLAPEMWRLKLRKQVFLQQDTHWTPDAMKIMAEFIAKHVRTKYPQALKPTMQTPIVDARLLDRANFGDLVAGLDVAAPGDLFSQEQVTLVSIVGLDPRSDSTVTLIGDSFASIYDDPALGFAAENQPAESQPMKAGLGNQLAVLLNEPLDVIADGDGNSLTAMQKFAARPDDDLATKKLVIWVLSSTALLDHLDR